MAIFGCDCGECDTYGTTEVALGHKTRRQLGQKSKNAQCQLSQKVRSELIPEQLPLGSRLYRMPYTIIVT